MNKDTCCIEKNSCCDEDKTFCCQTNTEKPSTASCAQTPCCTATVNSVLPVSTQLSSRDRLGAWKVRWGIGRMYYRVEPGLYAAGNPGPASPVLVSANYKLSFDILRKELYGLDCWLLVLDTKGVNVWCAAGKGTFGTDELVNRIAQTALAEKLSHRRLVVPQLGASGLNAHEVFKRSGFSVSYGPVRACDVKAYLAAGGQATEEMRTVRFTVLDRLVLTPVELVAALKNSLPLFGVLFIINLFAARPFGLTDVIAYAGAVFIGTVITPLLLPIIPGSAFSWKGCLLGLFWAAGIVAANGWYDTGNWLLMAGYMLVLPSLSSYLALNFTGSTTYTSFSGVTKEMKLALPPIIISAALGSIMLLCKSFIG